MKTTQAVLDAVAAARREGRLVEGPPVRLPDAGGLPGDDAPPTFRTEKAFMAAVVALARRHGWWPFHVHDSRRSAPGLPDLILVRERVLFRELKLDRGRLTADQTACLTRLLAAGADADVWRPRDWPTIVRVLGGPHA